MSGEAHIASAAASAGAGRSAKAYRHLRRALCLGPAASEAWNALIHLAWREGGLERAAGAMKRELAIKAAPATPRRSVVIPVIDGSPGSPYNIHTLLNDLATFDGEVVCVLNDATMFRDLSAHPRIDKFCFNSRNAGVGRAWNIGLNLAEGAFVFILNSDLHATPQALHRLETFLEETADAVIAGVMGEWFDPGNLLTTRRIEGDALQAPTEVDRASGYCFAVHAERFHSAGLCFDPRLGPFFYEETDIAIRARERRLKVYAVPVAGVDHRWGISQNPRPVTYFGRSVDRNHVLLRNAQLILQRGRR
jgi:glycosyltransferase involved in cell wall biosynthesis